MSKRTAAMGLPKDIQIDEKTKRLYTNIMMVVEDKYKPEIEQAFIASVKSGLTCEEFYVKLMSITGLEMQVIEVYNQLKQQGKMQGSSTKAGSNKGPQIVNNSSVSIVNAGNLQTINTSSTRSGNNNYINVPDSGQHQQTSGLSMSSNKNYTHHGTNMYEASRLSSGMSGTRSNLNTRSMSGSNQITSYTKSSYAYNKRYFILTLISI